MFDNIFAAIEKWMRELLSGMVESNLSTMFTAVNQQTSEIAAQVGQTPQGWNSSIFSMIRNISDSVVIPIAGIIITLILCYELISMLTERNNLHDVDTWMFFKYFVKMWIAVYGTVKETHYGVFICKRKKNTTPCAYHAVPEKMLMMVAMDQIHHLVSTMCEEEKLVKDMMRSSNLDSARSIKMKENSILFRIQEAEERRLRLYEDYKAEILDEDEYSQLKEHYIAEKQRLEHELQKQRQRALELEKRIKICDAQMERMRGILNQNEFDEELVHELIKRIYVGMDNSVEVEFKCSDPYQEVLAIMSEVQNE